MKLFQSELMKVLYKFPDKVIVIGEPVITFVALRYGSPVSGMEFAVTSTQPQNGNYLDKNIFPFQEEIPAFGKSVSLKDV